MTKFAFNVATFVSVDLFSFMINYDYELRMSFNSSNVETINWLFVKERILTHKIETIIEKMKKIWEFTKKKLINTQNTQKRYADQRKNFLSEYQIRDMIWLFTKNIKTKRSSKKLDHKWMKSYRITKVLKDVCQLNLLSLMKIHNIFHTFLLRKVAIDSFTDQTQFSSLSIVMNEEEKYEMNDILDNRYHYDNLQYKIVWIDHSSNRVWYSAENFEHARDILTDYHQRYSEKFESNIRHVVIIEAMLSQWIRNEHKKVKQLIQDVLNERKEKMKENDRKRSCQFKIFIKTFDRH
jgi:hypothetical protein